MFAKLMPQEPRFFELFAALADEAVKISRELDRNHRLDRYAEPAMGDRRGVDACDLMFGFHCRRGPGIRGRRSCRQGQLN